MDRSSGGHVYSRRPACLDVIVTSLQRSSSWGAKISSGVVGCRSSRRRAAQCHPARETPCDPKRCDPMGDMRWTARPLSLGEWRRLSQQPGLGKTAAAQRPIMSVMFLFCLKTVGNHAGGHRRRSADPHPHRAVAAEQPRGPAGVLFWHDGPHPPATVDHIGPTIRLTADQPSPRADGRRHCGDDRLPGVLDRTGCWSARLAKRFQERPPHHHHHDVTGIKTFCGYRAATSPGRR
jgi:hypothetical protein